MRRWLMMLLCAITVVAFTGCEQNDTEDAIDDMGDGIEDAGDAMEEGIEDAGEGLEELGE